MRAAVYLRVSSDKQVKSGTIDSQARDVPARCALEGWPIVREYADPGASAKTGNMASRPGLLAMLRDAEARAFEVVVCQDIDRLTRADMFERGFILGTLERAGVQLVTVVGGVYDLSSVAGEIGAMVHARGAQDWLEKHRARVKAGKLTAIERGRKPAGPTPYGYHYDRSTHTWSVDDATSTIVREIKRRVAGGASCYELAADLDRRAVPRPRGGRWSRESVWKIARARTYLGEWIADRARRLVVPVPAIITAAEHDAALAALAARGSGAAPAPRRRHIYLLETRAQCGRSGHKIGVVSAVTQRTRDLYTPARYVCVARRRPPSNGERCDLPYEDVIATDAAVWDELVEYVTAPGLMERVLRRRREQAGRGGPDPRVELDRARGEVDRLDAAERTVLDRHGRGLISDGGLDAQLGKLAAARQVARAALAAGERAVAGPRLAIARADGIEDAVALLRERGHELPVELRQQIVRAMVSSVTILDGEVHMRIRIDRALLGRAFASGSSTPALGHDEGEVRFLLPRRWSGAAAAAELAASVDVAPTTFTAPATIGRDGQVQNARGERLERAACEKCDATFWRVAGDGHRFCRRACWYGRNARTA